MSLAKKASSAPAGKGIPAKTAIKSSVKTPSRAPSPPVQWNVESRPVPYDRATAFMEAKVNMIHDKSEPEQVWLLEHPPVYTAGTSANTKDLLTPSFPVYSTGRGGQYTYHGPGQRVAYVMLDLMRRKEHPGMDLRAYVRSLEEWVIQTLKHFDVKGERRDGRVGIWVDMKPYGRKGEEAKIAAIGVRVRKWITFHGIALNVNPDLSHYKGIVPCGIKEHGVTSLADLGIKVSMEEVDRALKQSWSLVF